MFILPTHKSYINYNNILYLISIIVIKYLNFIYSHLINVDLMNNPFKNMIYMIILNYF